MKETELQEMFTSNTKDGETDYNEISKSINEKINTIRDNHTEKTLKEKSEELYQTNVEKFIKENGYENVDQFSAFVNNAKATSTELSEKATRIEKEKEEINNKYKELEDKYSSVSNEFSYLKNSNLLKAKGVNDDMLEFALFEANKKVKDDVSFEEAINTLLEEKPSLFSSKEQGFVVGKENEKGKENFESDYLKEFNKNKKRYLN